MKKPWQISGTFFARTGLPYTVFDGAQGGLLTFNNVYSQIYAVPSAPIPRTSTCGRAAAAPSASHPCQPAQVLASGDPNPEARFLQSQCETGFNTGNLPGPSGLCGGAAVALAQRRNHFAGPGYFNTDFSVMKKVGFRGWDKGKLGLGLQFFNLLNHSKFGLPNADISYQSFGQIVYTESPPTGILGAGLGGDASPRNIQLKAQLEF